MEIRLNVNRAEDICFFLFYSFHPSVHVPCEKFRWRQVKSVSGNQALMPSEVLFSSRQSSSCFLHLEFGYDSEFLESVRGVIQYNN